MYNRLVAHVYLETSFVSACVSERQDVASACRRQTSCEWWDTQRATHNLFISAEVFDELSHPASRNRQEALQLVASIPRLAITDDVRGLARLLVREKVMPAPVAVDAVHVAVATVHGVDYLLSWNVRHQANPNKLEHLRTVCRRVGLMPPQIVTPDLLWETEP
jgi:predicted nucleic acid-binding protein